MSQLKGSQKGCKLGKRSAIRGFNKMSDRRKALVKSSTPWSSALS